MTKHPAQRGQAMPLVAIALLAALAAAGLATDVGYHQYRQRLQQTATDSAALAAAQEMLYGSTAAKAAGQRDASINGFTDNTGGNACTSDKTCVTITTPDGDTNDAYYNVANTAEAVIQSPNATFFEALVGIQSVTITTKAVAKLVDEPADFCLVTTSQSIGSNFHGGTVNAPNCGMGFNGTVGWNGATVNDASIVCSPTAASCGGGNGSTTSFTHPPVSGVVSDPCSVITYCAKMSNPAPPSCSGASVTAGNNKAFTLTPGCYSSITANKASSITITCGFYVITGTFNARPTGNNPTAIPITQTCPLNGATGVTFYLTGSGNIDFGNDVVQLSAPNTGDYSQYSAGEQNMLIYQDPADTATLNMNSAGPTCGIATCNSYYYGMIYAPSANLNYNQYSTTSTGQVLIVVGGINANNGVDNFLSAPGGGGSTIKTPVLAE